MFFIIALSIWAFLHAYVFWRLGSAAWIGPQLSWRVLVFVVPLLWASVPLARMALTRGWDRIGLPFEFLAMTWMGVLFLLFAFLLLADVLTLFGWLLPSWSAQIRCAAIIAALAASVIALIQGARDPQVRDYELSLPNLPASADGYTFVAISDLHLGTILGEKWLGRLVDRIDALEPQAVLIAGDIVDGDVHRVARMIPVLQKLNAPDGVWAVTGNHDFYAGLGRSVGLLEEGGIAVLRDRAAELIPGVFLAGVDDFSVPLEEGRQSRLDTALAGLRREQPVILLSHTPELVQNAADAGVDLMLSGHTHNGQIWPFNWIVRTRFQHVYGLYEVDAMKLVVSSGAGTWGPPMRLWARGEILRIRLRRET